MKKVIVPMILILVLTMSQKLFSQETVKDRILNAQNLVKQGQKAEASIILLKIMEEYPENKEAVQWWLIANMKRTPTGEMDAIQQLDSLTGIYHGNTGILFFKSFILAEYGKNEEALAGFDKLIVLQPDSAINYVAKGQILSALKRHQEAIEAFDKATTLHQKRFDVWAMKASSLAQLKKYDDAISAMNRAVDLAPGNAVNYYNRACMFSLKGDKTNALADLKKAVEINPTFKQNALKDEDFKSLWEDADFKELTK
jgi:tetratricopeptide (TPR) repeat protein